MGHPAINTDRRFGPRREVTLAAHIKLIGKPRIPCTVRNISPSGALIEFATDIELPATFRLDIDQDLFEVNCELRHGEGRRFGVEFTSNRQGALANYG